MQGLLASGYTHTHTHTHTPPRKPCRDALPLAPTFWNVPSVTKLLPELSVLLDHSLGKGPLLSPGLLTVRANKCVPGSRQAAIAQSTWPSGLTQGSG